MYSENIMNFYLSVFPEKETFLENIRKVKSVWGKYPLIFIISD